MSLGGLAPKRKSKDVMLCVLEQAAFYYRPDAGRFVFVPEAGREVMLSQPDADRIAAAIRNVLDKGVGGTG